MLATVCSGAVYGVDAHSVEIEVNAGQQPSFESYGGPSGDPQTVIVGLPDATVRESKDRGYTALLNSGFRPHVAERKGTAPLEARRAEPCEYAPRPVATGSAGANSPPNGVPHSRLSEYPSH